MTAIIYAIISYKETIYTLYIFGNFIENTPL